MNTLKLLLLVAAICLNSSFVTAQMDQVHIAADSCSVFPCRWQTGEQNYQLNNQWLTGNLLSIDQLLKMAGPTEIDRDSPTVWTEQPTNESIQLASFQEEVSEPAEADDQNAVPEPKQEVPSKVRTDSVVSIYVESETDELKNELDLKKEAIIADTQLSDTIRASRLQIISSANEALLKINEADGLRITYDNQMVGIEDTQAELEQKLDIVPELRTPEIENKSSELLIRDLNEFRDGLEKEKRNLQEIESQIQFHFDRVSKIPRERSSANEQLKQIREEVEKRSMQTDDADNQLALILLELRFRAAEAVLKKLDSEEIRQQWSTKIDLLKRDLSSRTVKRLEEEVSLWDKEVKKLRDEELREEEMAAREEANNAHVFLTPLAKRNEELISDQKKVVKFVFDLKEEKNTINQQVDSIIDRRSEIENKIEAAGLTGTNGMLLVDLRRNLMSTGESHIRILQLQKELRRVNLIKVGLNEERDELTDPVNTILNRTQITEEHELFDNAMQFVETKRDYLGQLINDYQSYGRLVSEVSEVRKKLIDEVNETITYIDENAIWVRSADPVALNDLKTAQLGAEQFFDSQQWVQIVANTQQRASQRPYQSTAALLTLIVLAVANRRMKFKLQSNHHE